MVQDVVVLDSEGAVVMETVAAALDDGAATDGESSSVMPVAILLRQPARVAVAGQIECGKSVLVKALGERIAATGQLEPTRAVHELPYGDEPSVMIRYENSTAPHRVSAGRFQEFTVHPGKLLRNHYGTAFAAPWKPSVDSEEVHHDRSSAT